MNETVFLDASFMDLLCQYVETDVDEVSCLVAKFLNAFANDSSFIESYEVDNFILKNANVLSTWSVVFQYALRPLTEGSHSAWRFYGVQQPDISSTRPALLLRVLTVDCTPLHALLDDVFSARSPWETRYVQSNIRQHVLIGR